MGIPVSYVAWSYGNYSGRNVVAEVRGAVTPGKVLLVDVQETLSQVEPGQWSRVHPSTIGVRAQAAEALREARRRGYRVAYLAATAATPLEYRIVRGWIAAQRAAKDGIPAGPVLGRRDYGPSSDADQSRRDAIGDLKTRLGDHLVFVTRTPFAASAGTNQRVQVILQHHHHVDSPE